MFTGLGFNVKQEFKNISRATLNIKVEQLDFTEGLGRPAAESINSWVSNVTDGKINDIISSGTCHMNRACANLATKMYKLNPEKSTMFIADSLHNQTQVVLVNTIHFKAPWEQPFKQQDTRNATFYLNSNEETYVAMMTAEYKYRHANLQELNAMVVVIPYKVGQLA